MMEEDDIVDNIPGSDDDCEEPPPKRRYGKKHRRSIFDDENVLQFFQTGLIFPLTLTINGHTNRKAFRRLSQFSIHLSEPFHSDQLDNSSKEPVKLLIAENIQGVMLVLDKNGEYQRICGKLLPQKDYSFNMDFFRGLLHQNTFILSITSESDPINLTNDNEACHVNEVNVDQINGVENKETLTIEIWLTVNTLKECTLDEQIANSENRHLLNVMSCLFGYPSKDLTDDEVEPPLYHIEEVYGAIRKYHDQTESKVMFQKPDGLLPTLRNYQKRSVEWMLSRENFNNMEDEAESHPLWIYNEQLELLFNKYGGYFREREDDPKCSPEPLGGILADEMGLGKTVEILALLLSHPRKNCDIIQPLLNPIDLEQDVKYLCKCGYKKASKGFTPIKCDRCSSLQHQRCVNYDKNKWSELPYYCPYCWVDSPMPKLKSRATLIITPQSIYHQWQEEITKHIDSSSVDILLYEGVSSGYIYPYDLANKDIVLASYETLRSDLKFVDLPKSDRFRRPKRFYSTPSPLLAIDWWRIVLDEAQMVESVSSQAAQMAGNLSTINRWCVTGTPIQKSINDIFGLVLFIGQQPYCNRLWWKLLIADPYCSSNMEPITSLLKKCFWRNSKKDVALEIGLPERKEHIIRLNFAPIEEHFYFRQKEKCIKMFCDNITSFDDLDTPLKKIDHKTYSKLMTPLLKLRQACCHPQVVGNQLLSISKKTMTMEEVLETMIKNSSYECEEEHRKVLSSLNGQAGIYIIREDFEKAVEIYRSVLRSIETYKEKFRTDKLQLYHTLYNLSEILQMVKLQPKNESSTDETGSSSSSRPSLQETMSGMEKVSMEKIGYTLRDDSLKQDAENLRQEYLSKGIKQTEEAQKQLEAIVETTSPKIKILNSDWWVDGLNEISDRDEVNQFMMRIREMLEEHALKSLVKQGQVYQYCNDKCREISGLEFIVATGLDELKQAREDLCAKVRKMHTTPTDREFNDAVDCHLRPRRDDKGKIIFKKKCNYCLIHEMFEKYEGKLYYFAGDATNEEEDVELLKTRSASRKISSRKALEERRGNWSDSEIEQTLKTILNTVSKYAGVDKSVVEQGKKMIEFFDMMKREFRSLRAVWMNIYDYVSQLDELNMATIRLRKRFPDEPKPDETVKYILEQHEVDDTLIQLGTDERVAREDLKKKLAHLNFLRNLMKTSAGRRGVDNPDPCPICTYPLGSQWTAFMCGHSYCLKCTDLLIEDVSVFKARSEGIKCAICRQWTKTSQLIYVDTRVSEAHDPTIKVHGSWSTKVEEFIRTLIKIQLNNPDAKCLAFSSWTTFLFLLSRALDENKIKHILADKPKKFAANVDQFKNDDVNVLLMPIALGSKGLNLIEANHVLLVEPLLDPSHEYQAIGRVHRIGQTKPTHVYKFIVNKTIEEKIDEMFSLQCGFNDFSDLQENERTCSTIKHIFDLLSYDRT